MFEISKPDISRFETDFNSDRIGFDVTRYRPNKSLETTTTALCILYV